LRDLAQGELLCLVGKAAATATTTAIAAISRASVYRLKIAPTIKAIP